MLMKNKKNLERNPKINYYKKAENTYFIIFFEDTQI